MSLNDDIAALSATRLQSLLDKVAPGADVSALLTEGDGQPVVEVALPVAVADALGDFLQRASVPPF